MLYFKGNESDLVFDDFFVFYCVVCEFGKMVEEFMVLFLEVFDCYLVYEFYLWEMFKCFVGFGVDVVIDLEFVLDCV